MLLSDKQKIRYRRNIQLSELGIEGQKKLLSSKVLVIGVGGLGSPVAMYLGAAGVGTLGLIDDDVVDMSNLQRQVIYNEEDLGQSKAEVSAKRIRANNSDVVVNVYNNRFDEQIGSNILKEYDFVIDATDSILTKFFINDLCVENEIPFCHGGVLEFVGQVMTVVPGKTACFRCFFKKPPEGEAARKCSHAGILGAVAGTVGTIQATETLKYVTGAGKLLTDSLLIYEADNSNVRTIPVKRDSQCISCSKLF